jgi:hypothetical protein
MNLSDKLDRFFREKPLQAAPVQAAPVIEPVFFAAQCERIIHTFPPCHSHGNFNIGDLEGQFPEAAQVLLPQLSGRPLDFKQIAFIDTETTGLSGGIGVCAFLIGIGSFTEDGFAVEQFLMHDYPAEQRMLETVCQRLESFGLIASYNGRSFDIPILEGRIVLNGIRNTISDKPHLDMLHPARRLWKHRLNDCSLKNIEGRALGGRREGDIEGWMIPQAYFSYLRTRNPHLMEQILHHNRLDLLSLACITNLILKAVNSPQNASFEHGEEWYGLGTLFGHYQKNDEVIYCFKRALQAGLPESLRQSCCRMLSLTHKRAGDWDNAARLWWESSTSRGGATTIFEFEELAKYYEHRLRDYASAREVCRRAVAALEIKAATSSEDVSDQLSCFEHRLQRVERKLQREKLCVTKESSLRRSFS